MANARYRQYLKVLNLWPTYSVSRSKQMPTLDQYLAQQIHENFDAKEALSPEDCECNLASLERLVKNTYKLQYERKKENEVGVMNQDYETAKRFVDDSCDAANKKEERRLFIKSLFKPSKSDKS